MIIQPRETRLGRKHLLSLLPSMKAAERHPSMPKIEEIEALVQSDGFASVHSEHNRIHNCTVGILWLSQIR